MATLLLFISFLLHIILLSAVYYLYKQLQQVKEDRDPHLETLMSEFLQEIKAENDRLELQLNEQTSSRQHFPKKEQFPEAIEEKPLSAPLYEKNEKDSVKTSLEGQILHLYEQGCKAEEIAKKLNRGKTEVELILKMKENKAIVKA